MVLSLPHRDARAQQPEHRSRGLFYGLRYVIRYGFATAPCRTACRPGRARLDLPPALCELDQRIERVELTLRSVLAGAADGDASRLPPHVLAKLDERVQRELKKNPALDAGRLQSLAGRLEYADLRELQDAIVGKALWEAFAARFGAKEALGGKFNQLAELRNVIRHSRATTAIRRMEGDAAILWFEQTMKDQLP